MGPGDGLVAGARYNYNELIALVHPPHSPYLLVTPIKNREIEPFLIQALCTLFDCPRAAELQLFGNDIDTLKDLALQEAEPGRIPQLPAVRDAL